MGFEHGFVRKLGRCVPFSRRTRRIQDGLLGTHHRPDCYWFIFSGVFCPACQYLHLLHGLGWLRKHLSATKRRPQSINQWPSIRSHPDERSGGKHTPSSVWDAMFPLSTHPPARIHRIDFPNTSTRPSPLMRINGTGAEMCSTRCRAVHTGAIYTEHGLMSSTRAGTGSSAESGSKSAP